MQPGSVLMQPLDPCCPAVIEILSRSEKIVYRATRRHVSVRMTLELAQGPTSEVS